MTWPSTEGLKVAIVLRNLASGFPLPENGSYVILRKYQSPNITLGWTGSRWIERREYPQLKGYNTVEEARSEARANNWTLVSPDKVLYGEKI